MGILQSLATLAALWAGFCLLVAALVTGPGPAILLWLAGLAFVLLGSLVYVPFALYYYCVELASERRKAQVG